MIFRALAKPYNTISSFQLNAVAYVIVVTGLYLLSSHAWASKFKCAGQRMTSLEMLNSAIKCAVVIDDTLVFPRNIATRDDEIWLVDKGSNLFTNGQKKGALYRYTESDGAYKRTQVLAKLDDPNDIAIRRHANGDDWVYFTTRDKVQRFKLNSAGSPSRLETLIAELPTDGWHKLLAIHITQDALFVTVPSITDHCEVTDLPELVHYPCLEEQEGTAEIRQYDFAGDKLGLEYTLVAQGLRDALAVQINRSKTRLVVADNGWDQIDLRGTGLEYSNTPHDEINVVDLSKNTHFGWPYCFDKNSVTPPYQRFIDSCEAYQPPWRLLPAHSAPLDMLYLENELLVNLHGNSDAGGKTIAFKLNPDGLPISQPYTKIEWRSDDNINARPFGLATTHDKQLLSLIHI